MSPASFKYFKEDTRFRKAISSAERLCLTLHYLEYGSSQQALSFYFRVAKYTICFIINQTCKAIWECLGEQYVRPREQAMTGNVLTKILKTSGI